MLRHLVLLLVLAPAGAEAALLTATFSGTITGFDTQLDDGTFVVGEAVTGSFGIDTEAVDSEPLPSVAYYDFAVTDISVEFGGYPVTAATGFLFIGDPTGDFQSDEFSVSAEPPSGAPVGGLPIYTFNFQLVDTTRTALSSDEIPSSLDLADFDSVSVMLTYLDGSSFYGVLADVASLTYVPEPGGIASTAMGALAVLALGRGARPSRGARHPDPLATP